MYKQENIPMKKSINSKRAIIEHLRLKVRKLLKEENGGYGHDDPRTLNDNHPSTIPSDTVNLHHNMNAVSNPDGTKRRVFDIQDENGNGVGPLDPRWFELEHQGTIQPVHGMRSVAADDYVRNLRKLHKAGHISHLEYDGDIVRDPQKIAELLEPDGEMYETIDGRVGLIRFHMHDSFDPEKHLDEYGRVSLDEPQ